MELNDYEYKMDSSLDTTDSDFLTNDDDYGQNLLNLTNEQEVQTCL